MTRLAGFYPMPVCSAAIVLSLEFSTFRRADKCPATQYRYYANE